MALEMSLHNISTLGGIPGILCCILQATILPVQKNFTIIMIIVYDLLCQLTFAFIYVPTTTINDDTVFSQSYSLVYIVTN